MLPEHVLYATPMSHANIVSIHTHTGNKDKEIFNNLKKPLKVCGSRQRLEMASRKTQSYLVTCY